MMRFARTWFAATWLALLLFSGCASSEAGTTAALVGVYADHTLISTLQRVEARIYPPMPLAGQAPTETLSFEVTGTTLWRAGEVGFPFSFGVQKGRQDGFILVLAGYVEGRAEPLIEHKLSVRFTSGETVFVSALLTAGCVLRSCSADQTCSDELDACVAVPQAPTRVVDDPQRVDLEREGPNATRDAGLTPHTPAPEGGAARGPDLDGSAGGMEAAVPSSLPGPQASDSSPFLVSDRDASRDRHDAAPGLPDRMMGEPLPDAAGPVTKPDASTPRTGLHEGLALLLRMEETTWSDAPGVVRDESGAENHGTRHGAATTSPSGLRGRAGAFPGDAWIEVSDHPSLQPSRAFTVSVWFWVDRLPSEFAPEDRWPGIVAKRFGYDDQTTFSMFLSPSDQLVVGAVNEGQRLYSRAIVSVGQWHHAVLVFDGTRPEAERLALYFDGALDGMLQKTESSAPPYMAPLLVGRLIHGGQTFLGRIDEVAFWQRALSESEISALYRDPSQL